jgi:hypothetical protein
MSYLTKKQRIEKIKSALHTVLIYTAIIAVLAAVVLQWYMVKLLDEINQRELQQEAIESYEPTSADPCGLLFVDCAEASEPEVATTTDEVKALREYLIEKGGVELAQYAEEIVKLDRWHDVVAIAWHETQFCTTGVGASQNNCGGIKSHQAGRTFKHYETVFDSVWDIAYLLNKPRFKGLAIADMNGIYCVDEANGGGKCPHWTESITKVANELAQLN